MIDLDWSRWPNFSADEMRCKGSGKCLMDPGFMDRLQRLRNALGLPMPVSSGYRSQEYNAQVSKTGRNGPHTTGRAVDITCDGGTMFKIIDLAPALGFTGIGIGRGFIHLDDLPPILGARPRPWVWNYS